MKHQSASALYRLSESIQDVQIQQRLSKIVVIVLLVVSAWILGRLIWQPFTSESITQWQPKPSNNRSSNVGSSVNLTELQNGQLFGQYQEQRKVVEKPKVQDAPKSQLNVVLVGVVTSTNPDKNLAVIANRGKQVTYGIGEVIEGTRAKLYQVQQDRVIVDNSGRNETVMLEGLKYERSEPRQVAEPPPVSQDKLEQIRDEIRQDTKQVFQYVRMSMVKNGNDIVGYRLSPGKDPALFKAVGLESGDIATQINGLDLKDSAVMGEIFKNLSELTELTLTVERDGQPYEIYIEL
ncbi:type II secretion system protein GspC [Vibrio japonicus]|uniref:Type II secretion system protein GspC n=1 Tax=Vibrio japonicus TaxID=1824638 RepID=A0ABY5LER7_9VIBR|nr:type II secretion system protein GspC [Vibrio japonicus]UUM30527.1 type II secretion system protein GspC [Vibrio japonicus]